ncbi:MAG: GNAT family N-acetyltransferase [Saprospiraceae bacterium]|nr:GNAT family N-acetyltransferase [Saprospiraceae bacterium]MDW8229307.1 GNAT family N-acetyltransferase [Saprospiraceae bacterium]
MTHSALISSGKPSEAFWEAYEYLWKHSAERSPFEAPGLLRYFAESTLETPTTFSFYQDGVLRGAVVLKERHGVCTFLSDLKTDVNTFVLDRRCSEADRRTFCYALLAAMRERRWSLECNNQPLRADYLRFLEMAAHANGLTWTLVPHSVCPLLEANTPVEVERHLQKNQRYRYYAQRLRKQDGALFQAHTDAEGLEDWVEAYCNAHVQRWANTPTPSDFRDSRRRQFLLGCLRAWHNDGLAVRFSLCLPDGRRIAFAIGLLQPPALVFHATTFDPAFARYSPGKALIFHIAGWMAQNNLSVLDFGDGDEPYKYDVATTERPLSRVFISPRQRFGFRAKARAFQWLKAHPHMESIYRLKMKPMAAKIAVLLHALQEMMEVLLAGL